MTATNAEKVAAVVQLQRQNDLSCCVCCVIVISAITAL